MVRILFILCFLALSISSCASSKKVKTETDVAGYNLKSKKEQMHNKIIHNRNKTMLAVQ